jgi:hypothetical protein
MITDSQGDPLRRRELLRRIGRLEQVAGIELFVFDDGPAAACAPSVSGPAAASPST